MTVLALLFGVLLSQSADRELKGTVVDTAGLPVPGAVVSSGDRAVTTDGRGAFSLKVGDPSPPSTLIRVSAPGFLRFEGRPRSGTVLRIVLQPAAVAEVLTVTAARSERRLADTATATSSLPAAVILTAGALMPDDLLRSVPGFSLFRRSSSRVANPTTQGASLRGLAASGASRALVMADGVPLNDPFGGWVYWNRVPLAAIDQIEVVRGGAGTDLYGHESLAGTVQLLTRRPTEPTVRFTAEAGQHGSRRVSGYAGTPLDRWMGFASAERLVLDGFPIVAPDERGPVDVNAGVRHTSALASASRAHEGRLLDVRGNWLAEKRDNGTPLQWNDTRQWGLAGRVSHSHERGAWSASAHGGATRYRQTFSAVNATRTAETLTATQHIDADYQGVSAQWTGVLGAQAVLAGAEFRRNDGESLDAARGGTQNDGAVYGRLTLQLLDNVTLNAGVRGGVWSTDARAGAGGSQRRGYIMPRVSVAWSPSAHATLSASWSAPARTPTLNELYRDFRVGGTVTLANDRLRPEEASAFEAGVLVRAGAASARVVGFWTEVDDAIANVTLATGALITRQRQNAGGIRARGLEVESEWRASSWVSVVASAALLDSSFTRSPEAALVGNRVPHVPRWQAGASVRLTPGRAAATIDWRVIGPQFDDDRNQFLLRRGFTTDAFAGLSFTNVQPFVAIENLFDAEVDVGRTPVRTIGTPRTARAGLRLFF